MLFALCVGLLSAPHKTASIRQVFGAQLDLGDLWWCPDRPKFLMLIAGECQQPSGASSHFFYAPTEHPPSCARPPNPGPARCFLLRFSPFPAGKDRSYQVSNSCKAEAVMRAAMALAHSEWFFLVDDDTVVRRELAAAMLSRFDWRVKHAFGMYPCGAERRAPRMRMRRRKFSSQRCCAPFRLSAGICAAALRGFSHSHALRACGAFAGSTCSLRASLAAEPCRCRSAPRRTH